MLQPQGFWNFIRNKSRVRDLPLPLKHGDLFIRNVGNACDTFNDCFSSVFDNGGFVKTDFKTVSCVELFVYYCR